MSRYIRRERSCRVIAPRLEVYQVYFHSFEYLTGARPAVFTEQK